MLLDLGQIIQIPWMGGTGTDKIIITNNKLTDLRKAERESG